jgi:hypothetical protein
MFNYSDLCYIPLLFFTTILYRMGKDYIEVSYYEKLKEKIN